MSEKYIGDDGQVYHSHKRSEYITDKKYSKKEIKELNKQTNEGRWKVGRETNTLLEHKDALCELVTEVNKSLPEDYTLISRNDGASFWFMDNERNLESIFVRFETFDTTTGEGLYHSVAKGLELQSEALKKKKVKSPKGKWVETTIHGPAIEFKDGGLVSVGVKENQDSVPAVLEFFEFVFARTAVLGAGLGNLDLGAEVLSYIHRQFILEGKQHLDRLEETDQ